MKAAAATVALLMVSSAANAALQIDLQVGRIEGAALPAPVRDLHASCRLGGDREGLHCRDGRAALNSRPSGRISASFELALKQDASWSMDARAAADHVDLAALGEWLQALQPALKPQLSGSAKLTARVERAANGDWGSSYVAASSSMSFGEASGRYAADKLQLQAQGKLSVLRGRAALELDIASSAGQVYVEPVFVDLTVAPIAVRTRWQFDVGGPSLLPAGVDSLTIDAGQQGVFDQLQLRGSVDGLPAAAAFSGGIHIAGARLEPLLPRYVAPYLAGGHWQNLEGAGVADVDVDVLANKPTRIRIDLDDAGIKAGTPVVRADGLGGELNWSSSDSAAASVLSWRGLQYGDLPLGAATIRALAQGRSFRLQQAPRLPVLGGALVVDTLELQNIGTPQLLARFAASIEPIDLASLCKALGWPQFGGEISGRIPGVSIHDNELAFDGRLSVKAFDGEISIENLRMPDVFGRLPRVLASLRLRNLDLKSITQAFSFGRIEGRLSGDVDQLRLLNWRPVAFDAQLYTPADDRSRHRISQRAIDNLSSLGGGPTGLLQRGVLRFFEDFAYQRIGWSCRLENGVCTMDGIEPAKGGGYVLVKGRLLPRIDVIGYERRVDWDRFVAQLLAIRGTEGVEVR